MILSGVCLELMSRYIRSIGSAIVLSCLFFKTSFAQFYPVQVTPQLVPPYSVYLSDYATSGNEKLRVIVLQKDLAQPAYQLRLTMSVEWNGKVIMRTARSPNPAPINIDPGIPTIISGADLAPYLDSRNIDFVGYNREQYERTRALPEGSYRIFFTAYDYRRQDVQVSNEGSSFYYLSKNEPPLINFPACGTRIQFKDPQQIIFSWLPRNTSSPNSVAETEYEFTLFETRPAGRNPNDVINTTQPIFRTRTDVTQLVYGLVEPLLMEGMKYVWRVQAIDKNGRDAFRNNGFSEVCTFTYGGGDATFDIGVVKNLQAVGETERRAKISWEAINYDSYKVYYKKTGAPAGASAQAGSPSGASAQAGGYEWFWSEVINTELKLFDLEPDTEYETRVQVKKSGVFGPYSEIIKFRTTPIRVVECGQENVALAKGDVNKPLDAAHKGMTVDVDGIKMTILEVIPLGAGWFKGMGTATTKMLGASFHVKFDRLFIDENHIAGRGRIDFINKGVAATIQQQMVNQQKKEMQNQQKQNREQWASSDFQEKIFKYNILIADISFENGNGTVTITDSKGNSFPNTEIPQMLIDAPEKAIIIEDKNGDQWVVQKHPSTGETKATKVDGGGLVVGPDGKLIDNKTLRKLDKMILDALNKYKKAIEDYQVSIKKTQPGKGGGPSLFEDELEILYAELPVCLDEHKDKFETISFNIKQFVNVESEASKQFRSTISNQLTADFSTEEAKDNAPIERVEKEVCEALVSMEYDCPMWFSGECEDVGRILDKIKDLSSKGTNMVTRKPNNPDRKELIAENIELDGVSYKKIKILNLVESVEIIYNPRDYEEYSQQFLTAEGRSDHQRGFIYRSSQAVSNGNLVPDLKPIIVKILLYDDADNFEEQLKALRKYLYGEIPIGVEVRINEVFKVDLLTAAEIKSVRELISQVEDEEKKKELYLKLQEKVPYHNQKDNNQTAEIADRMCNLTSLAACFEMLGVSNPNPSMQFEDYLEGERVDNGYDARTKGKAWEKLANDLGLNYQYISLGSSDEDFLKKELLPSLKQGYGVMLSISESKGHIVRLQGISENGLIVDDPYGELIDFAAREAGTGNDYDQNDRTASASKGNNNLWTWSDLKKISLKYAYVFKP